ncbi:protein FAM240B [Cololabis saira]|uniref:protein FAM240B n=1 Tax=Cololabis saira TaxID=129043 RepID=UPI002AD3BEA2|nr:protein FAM240B [Cololabis saira]
MNVALVHDRLQIKSLWEDRINTECQDVENEEKRMNKSALEKLRGEWLVRLDSRNKNLKSLNENLIKKVKKGKS